MGNYNDENPLQFWVTIIKYLIATLLFLGAIIGFIVLYKII